MTAKLASQLAALIGRQGILEIATRTSGQDDKLRVGVLIREAKTSYGRPRVYVTPLAGDTETGVWVDADRVQLGAV